MRLCSFFSEEQDLAGIYDHDRIVSVRTLNRHLGTGLPETLSGLIFDGRIDELRRITHNIQLIDFEGIPVQKARLSAPYRNPHKIWGIGLNYHEHAGDLKAALPDDEPASFMKPATTIIGPGEPVRLPPQSCRTTGEAEIAVIIGVECKNITIRDVPDVILGYTTVIDMTAEDILQKNPRFLTRSKSFDTFFSFGPWIVTPEEIAELDRVTITTRINGQVHRSNRVGNMTFSPAFLVAFHSQVMTLKPGDIISCGTPGAVLLRPGDIIGCDVEGVGRLENPVRDAGKPVRSLNAAGKVLLGSGPG